MAGIHEYPELRGGNYMLHLSASTAFSSQKAFKVIVGSVEEAVKLGAIGVSIHISLGIEKESQMIRDFGLISEKCQEWGMPLLAMVYLESELKEAEEIACGARMAQELGADIVKVDYPGTPEGMQKVVDGVQIPVLIAGGDKLLPEELIPMIDGAMNGGASGVSMGRNIFQSDQPKLMTRIISKLVQREWSVEECLNELSYSEVELKI